ncbi:rifin, partial [Plasmodium reichenowi]
VNTHKKPHTTPHHTKTNRSLCEFDLYMSNYDNDPKMKSVIDSFNKQTQQRFHEYDDRMIEKRKQCKNKCDKEIQKIILKDKLEKELTEKLSTLQTDMQSDAIPTCVCEKSVADKVEKGCLRCGGVLGGGVAPSVGLLGGIGIYGWKMGVPAAAAKAAAKVEAAFAAIEEGMKSTIGGLEVVPGLHTLLQEKFTDLVTPTNFYCEKALVAAVKNVKDTYCVGNAIDTQAFCNYKGTGGNPLWYAERVKPAAEVGEHTYKTVLASKTQIFTEKNLAAVEATNTSCQTAIIASIVAIVVIILIMVIIYLILRHRRKKKMKKKLQYIKLLEE